MKHVLIFLKSFLIGFLISTPVSPVGIICFRRYIQHGPRIGFFSGLGSATADFIISIIAALGISCITQIIDVHENCVRLIGSILFILFGTYVLVNQPRVLKNNSHTKNMLRSYVSILLLTLSNPATIPSFVALFAALGVGGIHKPVYLVMLAGCISLGAIAWWSLLGIIMTFLKPHINYVILKRINTLCGIIIIVFGIVTLLRMLHIL